MHASIIFYRNSHKMPLLLSLPTHKVLHSLLHLLKKKCLNYLRFVNEDECCYEDLHSKLSVDREVQWVLHLACAIIFALERFHFFAFLLLPLACYLWLFLHMNAHLCLLLMMRRFCRVFYKNVCLDCFMLSVGFTSLVVKFLLCFSLAFSIRFKILWSNKVGIL